MCQAIDKMIQDGFAEGKAEATIEILIKYVKSGKAAVEEAAKYAGISVDEFKSSWTTMNKP